MSGRSQRRKSTRVPRWKWNLQFICSYLYSLDLQYLYSLDLQYICSKFIHRIYYSFLLMFIHRISSSANSDLVEVRRSFHPDFSPEHCDQFMFSILCSVIQSGRTRKTVPVGARSMLEFPAPVARKKKSGYVPTFVRQGRVH